MTSKSANARLETISSHLTQKEQTSTNSMADKRPPITCHVLDVAGGHPAANIPVTLLKLSSTSPSTSSEASVNQIAVGTTNSDGRVASWDNTFETKDGEIYRLRFETWEYFKGETFFPFVEVNFVVKVAEGSSGHYHVPLLLSPWSFTTYRGS